MLLSSPSSCSCSYSYSPQLPLCNSRISPTHSSDFPTSLTLRRRSRCFFYGLPSPPFRPHRSSQCLSPPHSPAAEPFAAGTLVEHLERSPGEPRDDDEKLDPELSENAKTESFEFDASFDSTELRRFDQPAVEVKDLDELPEQWRRSRLAWLCKELPGQKLPSVIRVLNAQRKWMRQDDATYIVVHCIRTRENETAFRVYKWMMQQHWFRFDFGLATKLADYMGKEQKYLRCREIFDDLLNQGRVPSESTFHILVGSYLSSSSDGCLEEACDIYNRMILLGGYKPRLSLHNALFRALVSKPGDSCKDHLKQAEFIFHNLTTCGLEIHKDIYGSLIWLHSYQDVVDTQRIASLRAEMRSKGFEESREVLVAVLRACSKEGDFEEAQKTWNKLLSFDRKPPPEAFLYVMEIFAKNGEPKKSLELFRSMPELLGATSVVAYQKIIDVLSKTQHKELAESLMVEFINSGVKPLTPSFAVIMGMYFDLGLHDKLEAAFIQCLEKCQPNRTIYNIYLDSLLQIGNLERAEEIFDQMLGNASIGVDVRSCNGILEGYLVAGDYVKMQKIHHFMCEKKYEVEPHLKEKLDLVLSFCRKVVKTPPRLKLSEVQREILVGMLLGGLKIVSCEVEKREIKKYAIRFGFSETSDVHAVLRRHIHDMYHEWLERGDLVNGRNGDVPLHFTTIAKTCFSFYAEQFWPNGRPSIPKLIHRWLSARVLAYWYMYGGHRTSRGDILLKLKGDREGVLRILRALKTDSLDCRVKKKGSVFWIGFEGSNASRFWNIVKPFILDDLQDHLRASVVCPDDVAETERGKTDCDENSDCSDNDDV